MKKYLLVVALLMCAVPAIAQDHTALVAAVKADLVARGVDISGPCGAFQITGRVGYLLRNEGWGLLHKSPGQNGCSTNGDRYAVDFLVHNPSGQGVDMLINSETDNTPAWQLFPIPPVPDLSTWRAPFQMDPDPPPPPPRVWIISEALDRYFRDALLPAKRALISVSARNVPSRRQPELLRRSPRP